MRYEKIESEDVVDSSLVVWPTDTTVKPTWQVSRYKQRILYPDNCRNNSGKTFM